MRIKVGVIFGGETVEHEVSIISALQAMNKIDQEKYDIIPIYMTKDREWYTSDMLRDMESFQDLDLIKRYAKNVVLFYEKGRYVLKTKGKIFNRVITDIDVIFPIVHGTNVEDGALQGYFQTIGIPYVGPNVYSAAVGQDKVYMKRIFEGEKIPMPKFTWFYDYDYKNSFDDVMKKIKKLNYPLIITPATTGSSVGISTASDEDELIKGIDDAINYDSKIIVEEMIENLKEVNISVLGNYETQKLSEIEEVISSEKFLTFEEKYIGNGKSKGNVKFPTNSKSSKGMLSATRKIPADITDKEKEEIKSIASRAFKALGSSGVCRIDFLIDEEKEEVYINEINSIPGSLAFYLWEPIGKKYTELLDDLINIAIKDYKKRSSKTHSFESNILSGFVNSSGIKGMKGKLR